MTKTRADGTSDFMARLASRATGNATAIEPRLPSLFERAPMESIGLESLSDEVDNSQPFAQRQNHPGKYPGASPSLENTQSVKLQVQGTATTDIPPVSPPPNFLPRQKNFFAVASSHDPDVPANVRLDRGQGISKSADSANPSSAAVTGESAHQPAGRELISQLRDDQGQIETPPSVIPRRSAVDGVPLALSPRRVQSEPPSVAGDQDLENRGFAQFAAPPSASRWRPQVPQVGLPNLPAPEPVINITIGRVEVRAAVSAASQPLTPKRGSAPLGLNDYLQGRTRGK